MDLSGVRDQLSRQGIRCTSQREHIFAALCATDRHPTAEELFQAVRVSSPGVSLATVYNTLEVFTSHGLCRRLATPQGVGACRYDADVTDHAHVITGDGSVRDLPSELSGKVLGDIARGVVGEVERRMGVRVGCVKVEFIEAPDSNGPRE